MKLTNSLQINYLKDYKLKLFSILFFVAFPAMDSGQENQQAWSQQNFRSYMSPVWQPAAYSGTSNDMQNLQILFGGVMPGPNVMYMQPPETVGAAASSGGGSQNTSSNQTGNAMPSSSSNFVRGASLPNGASNIIPDIAQIAYQNVMQGRSQAGLQAGSEVRFSQGAEDGFNGRAENGFSPEFQNRFYPEFQNGFLCGIQNGFQTPSQNQQPNYTYGGSSGSNDSGMNHDNPNSDDLAEGTFGGKREPKLLRTNRIMPTRKVRIMNEIRERMDFFNSLEITNFAGETLKLDGHLVTLEGTPICDLETIDAVIRKCRETPNLPVPIEAQGIIARGKEYALVFVPGDELGTYNLVAQKDRFVESIETIFFNMNKESPENFIEENLPILIELGQLVGSSISTQDILNPRLIPFRAFFMTFFQLIERRLRIEIQGKTRFKYLSDEFYDCLFDITRKEDYLGRSSGDISSHLKNRGCILLRLPCINDPFSTIYRETIFSFIDEQARGIALKMLVFDEALNCVKNPENIRVYGMRVESKTKQARKQEILYRSQKILSSDAEEFNKRLEEVICASKFKTTAFRNILSARSSGLDVYLSIIHHVFTIKELLLQANQYEKFLLKNAIQVVLQKMDSLDQRVIAPLREYVDSLDWTSNK